MILNGGRLAKRSHLCFEVQEAQTGVEGTKADRVTVAKSEIRDHNQELKTHDFDFERLQGNSVHRTLDLVLRHQKELWTL